MGRAKINMELIQDHKNRKSTFVKRKASLVKKISELAILCGIKACMIVYGGSTDRVVSQHDQIWPNDPKEVDELIDLYKNQPLTGRSKRAKTLSNFFENQKKKAEIKEEKYPAWDSRFDYLSQKELQNLARLLEKRIDDAKGKAEFLKSANIGRSSLLSHQEIRDYTELMNNNYYYNLMNQTTYSWPSIDYNNLFQENIPSGVISMGAGMEIQPLTIDDYQFDDAEDYSMKIEAENWLANNGIGTSSTIMEYPIIYNASTDDMPNEFQ